jgi:DNA-binding transcriptional LysR family regulator
METRELRYFVAVAEELHFGRAAERLGMAQPPLSRAIRQLERRLGVPLFERTSRTVALSGAGQVLLHEARTVLDAVQAAEHRTRRAGADRTGRMVLAAKAGASRQLMADLLDACARAAEPVTVDLLLCRVGEQERAVREGRADVALLHLPYDRTAGLDSEVLCTEPQVVLLPAGHPLARRTATTLDEIAALPDLPRPRFRGPDGSHPPGPGPAVSDHTQLLQLVALGRACTVAPQSCRADLPDTVAAVLVTDAAPVTTVLAWPPRSTSPELARLVRIAAALQGRGSALLEAGSPGLRPGAQRPTGDDLRGTRGGGVCA